MDTLTKWYNDKISPDMPAFQIFQAGVTAGAVSMRTRAMQAVENDPKLPKESLLNKITNTIGRLSDIPTE